MLSEFKNDINILRIHDIEGGSQLEGNIEYTM